MAIESATYINQLDATKPGSGDPKSEGDDHLRLLKSAIKATFPNVTGAVTATHTDLNKVGLTQASTSNDTSVASTAFVQSAILASSGITAQLPAQSGNSGKFLTTNGTAASWGEVVSLGMGGTTASGSVTLTAASPAMQSITTTGHGQSVTLPDATTLTRGVTVFGIANRGEYDLAVRDASGAIRGFVRPFGFAVTALADNTTSAGVWSLSGTELVGVSAGRELNAALANSGDTLRAVPLDANRTVLIFGDTSVYAVVCDKSTNTWGAVATVRTGIQSGRFAAIRSNTDQVLVTTFAATPQLAAIVLSISGTTITVNTAVTVSPGSSGGNGMDLVQVGTSFVVAYANGAPAGEVRAITISGTTPTIGTSVNTTTGPTGSLLLVTLSATTFVAVYNDGGGVYSRAYSVSGSTLTGGTQDSTTGTTSFLLHKVVLMPSGRVAIGFVKSSATFWVRLLTITGTTISASEVQVINANMPSSGWDWAVVGSSKLCICSQSVTLINYSATILTDTSGTISAGAVTSIPVGGGSSSTTFAALGVSGNNAKFLAGSTNSGGVISVVNIDASGTTPSFSFLTRIPTTGATSVTLAIPTYSGNKTELAASNLSNGTLITTATQCLGQLNSALIVGDQISLGTLPPRSVALPTARGNNTRESWAIASSGLSLQLLEMAQ